MSSLQSFVRAPHVNQEIISFHVRCDISLIYVLACFFLSDNANVTRYDINNSKQWIVLKWMMTVESFSRVTMETWVHSKRV